MRSDASVRLGFLVVAASLLAGCSLQATPTATPSATGTSAGTGWIAARVAQPAAIEGQPTDAPGFCSPCHPVVGTYIDSLLAFDGRYLALGFDQPPSHAAAWSSADGSAWQRVASLPAPQGSSISAAETGPDGGLVAVGTSGGAAAVWRTIDGLTWTLESLPAAPGAGATESLTAVARAGAGYVAGGSVVSATGRTATLWRSADGVAWIRVAAGLPSGSSEVRGIATAVGTGTVVAVGISGDERRGTAAVWRSTDEGSTWQSVSSPALAGGRMLATVAGSGGFVAVGETTDQAGAMAWTSADGLNWSSAADQPALSNGGFQMVMTAVARDGDGYDAAGWKTDAGNGSAVVWRSKDGRDWTRLPQDDSFSGAGMDAILATPRIFAAGTMGWPDTHAAQVWVARPG